MKKFYSFLFAAVALVGFAACNSDSTEEPAPAQENVGKMEFTANVDEATKTTLDGVSVKWCADDALWVNYEEFIIKDKENYTPATTAKFVGGEVEAPYVAVYPYSAFKYYDGVANVTLNLDANVAAGTFADGANIALAFSDDTNLSFKNLLSVLKFQVAAECETVTINSENPLVGGFVYGDDYFIKGFGEVERSIELTIDGGFKTGTTYYTTIIPGIHKFTVLTDGNPSREAKFGSTLYRNQVVDLGTLPVEIPAPADPAVIRINNMNGWGDLAITVKSGETTLVNAQAMTKEGDTNIFKYELDAEHVGKEVTYYITHSWYQTTTKAIILADTCEPIVLNTTYLQPNADGTYWGQGDAWFAAYFFGDGDGWVKAVKVMDNFYEVEIPVEKNFTNIIYCRMKNTDTSTLDFSNAWNQTSDLTIKHMCYCVNSWDKNSLNDSRWF